MIWTIDWDLVFRRQIREIPSPWAAADLCAAILQFAETETGPVGPYLPDNPRRLKARVPGAVGYLLANERTGVLHALRAYSRLT